MTAVRRLLWDPWNAAHSANHRVAPEEVEEVRHGDPVARQSYQQRLIVIGPTQAGRMLAVVLDPEGEGVYYPVTARPASRKERRRYQEAKGGKTR